MRIGANYIGNGQCEFAVWAPSPQEVTLEIVSPYPRSISMTPRERGYWQVTLPDISPQTQYWYCLNGEKRRPDPASHYQPQGVHQPSQVIDHSDFAWEDSNWQGIPLSDYIAYELHVGTFTPQGTFDAIIPRLPDLQEIGINAIEIMPVAQFPGSRNWGYDGVYPFAVQNSYGGPEGLKRLVNACHQQGMAVILDVVYNHFGPEGNYTRDFAPYFTDRYQTPWGSATNFDDAYSDGVRNFVIENALYWFREYHVDALRLDAIHAIYDFGAKHILEELAQKTQEFCQQQRRQVYLIAESDLNDVRVINPPEIGGYGIHAQWSDDFHHCIHTLLTGEQQGYYQDFGTCEQLAKAFQESFVYSWDYSPFRQRYHGSYAGDRPPTQFFVCSCNHDQVGNRMLGERLSHLVSFSGAKLAAASVLLSPYMPLLFMGEEYGESAPFLYFISHNDPDLVAAVREGRKQEFAAFHSEGEPPDAASIETFQKCQLNWEKRHQGNHQVLLNWYRHLIQLRRQHPALRSSDRRRTMASSDEEKKLVFLHRYHPNSAVFCIFNFNQQAVSYTFSDGYGKQKLNSDQSQWLGSGISISEKANQGDTISLPPQSVVMYEK